MEIVLLTGKVCAKCEELKSKLKSVGLDFTTVDMLSSEGMKLVTQHGVKSIPQVFVDRVLLGRDEYSSVLGVSLD